jgi:hypothetical protein
MKKGDLHHEQMGYQIPEGYLEQSKKEMLAFLEPPLKEQKPLGASWKKKLGFLVAAAIITVGVFFIRSYNTQIELFDQLTIESLEVSEEDFDQWFDENFVLNNV